jgi:hypothetical protein
MMTLWAGGMLDGTETAIEIGPMARLGKLKKFFVFFRHSLHILFCKTFSRMFPPGRAGPQTHERIARGGHGLPEASPRPAMPYPAMP